MPCRYTPGANVDCGDNNLSLIRFKMHYFEVRVLSQAIVYVVRRCRQMIPKYEPVTDQVHKLKNKTPKNNNDFLNVPNNDNNVVVRYQDNNGLRKKRSGKWLH